MDSQECQASVPAPADKLVTPLAEELSLGKY